MSVMLDVIGAALLVGMLMLTILNVNMNMTLETYIQNYTTSTSDGGPGSCVGCHSFATLAVGNPQPSADFSFLPGLAQPSTARSKFQTPK